MISNNNLIYNNIIFISFYKDKFEQSMPTNLINNIFRILINFV